MYISEIPRGSEVILTIKNKAGASATFSSVALEGVRVGAGHALIIRCVRHEGKVVNFDGFYITAEIKPPNEGGRSCKYIISGIQTTKRQGQTCHVLYSRDNMSLKEKRNAVRLPLLDDAKISIDESPTIDVKTKDISISGISFYVPDDIEVSTGSAVEGMFFHAVTNTAYNLSGTVAQVTPQDNGTCLIGCQFDDYDKQIIVLVTNLAKELGKKL